MTETTMQQVMFSPHFVQIVSLISRAWHSPSWQRRHPTIDLKAHFDGLHHLLQYAVFAQTTSGQTFLASLLALLEELEAADSPLSATAEDRVWLLAITRSRRALTVMLVLLTSIYSPVLATWYIRSKKAPGRATLLTRCQWMSNQGTMEGDGKVLSWQ